MKIRVKSFLHFVFFLIAAVAPTTSQAAILEWDPSPTPDIVGYNVYYNKNTPTFPFDGSDLSEGASPIKVDGSQGESLSLSLPEDGSMYYFTVTAFNEAGVESTYSNIVATEWFPHLIAPVDNAAINTVTTFTWNRPPTDFKPSTSIISFDLLYGTDPNLDENTMAFTVPNIFNFSRPQFNLHIILPLVMLLLLFVSRTVRLKRIWHPVRFGICIGVLALQVSCGGSGGGSGDTDTVPSTTVPSTTVPSTTVPSTTVPSTTVPSTTVPSTTVPSTPPSTDPLPLYTNVIYDILTTEYQITDLQPNTRYYWKIIAVDNWGATYESVTQSFSTLAD